MAMVSTGAIGLSFWATLNLEDIQAVVSDETLKTLNHFDTVVFSAIVPWTLGLVRAGSVGGHTAQWRPSEVDRLARPGRRRSRGSGDAVAVRRGRRKLLRDPWPPLVPAGVPVVEPQCGDQLRAVEESYARIADHLLRRPETAVARAEEPISELLAEPLRSEASITFLDGMLSTSTMFGLFLNADVSGMILQLR